MKKGFTLIELLIVVTVMGILIYFAGGYYASTLNRTRDTDRKADIKQYQVALENFANNNDSVYPIHPSTVIASTTLCTSLGTLLQSCPKDPKEPEIGFVYNYQSSLNGHTYVLWAKLEKASTYWVVCSNRKTGEKTAGIPPSSGTCPL